MTPKSLRWILKPSGEFARHRSLDIDAYFCAPRSPWQKGCVENSIGRLRRDFPRSALGAGLAEAAFRRRIAMHNATPRNCLAYQTPAEAFLAELNRRKRPKRLRKVKSPAPPCKRRSPSHVKRTPSSTFYLHRGRCALFLNLPQAFRNHTLPGTVLARTIRPQKTSEQKFQRRNKVSARAQQTR